MKRPKDKILIIELNEFCPKYLFKLANKYNLKNIKRFLNFNHTRTFSHENKEFHGLDPWVQWVSIHNGIPLSEHGVKRLGEESNKNLNQIWNYLNKEKNITWLVTGVMNSRRGANDGCISFFPDPWSAQEKAYPEELNHLLDLPRYVSKNYLSLNYFLLINKSLRTFLFFFKKDNFILLIKLLEKLINSIFKPGLNIHTLTTLLDYLLVLYFAKSKVSRDPNLSIIFLNHIAHLQHHFWEKSPKIHPQMEHGVKLCDEMLKILFNTIKDKKEKILVINGLKQIRSGKNGLQVYRQIDTISLLKEMGIKNTEIQQNMTNDCKLIFKNVNEVENALEKISNCFLSTGEKVFFIEKLSKYEIFMQLNLNHLVQKDVLIIFGKKKIPFYKLFSNLKRTGSHIPEGDIYSQNINIPDLIENHNVYSHIKNSFK